MNWNTLWLNLFGTTSFLGINMGFWAAMAAVCLIVIVMNAVFWGMKPPDTECPPQRGRFPLGVLVGTVRNLLHCFQREAAIWTRGKSVHF